MASALERHRTTGLLLGLGAVLAWHHRFLQDDAFISFHYARNLLEGQGLTWFGQAIEGYSNFLWVLYLAGAMALGADPGRAAMIGGGLSFLVALGASAILAERLLSSPPARFFAVAVLVVNFSFVSYATGGLETMFVTALQMLLLVLAVPAPSREDSTTSTTALLSFSFLSGLLLLTRPDSVLPVTVVGIFLLHDLRRSRQMGARSLAALLLPVGLLVGTWLLWKASYYGALLPNTYDAKLSDSGSHFREGAVYVGRFLHAYLLWPFLLAIPVLLWLRRNEFRPGPLRPWLPCLGLVLGWWAYCLRTGGDFMEFRFLIASLPPLALLLARFWIDPWPQSRRGLVTALSLALLALASAIHGLGFRTTTADLALDSIHQLKTFYGAYPDEDWSRIGQPLGQRLGDLEVTLGLTAVGAIPYYSRLRTVDLHGLTDREIARHGRQVGAGFARPGHQRYATLRQLRDRPVHLLLGHPTLVPLDVLHTSSPDQLRSWIQRTLPFEDLQQKPATLLVVPLDEKQGILAWYLTPHGVLEQQIAREGWPKRALP